MIERQSPNILFITADQLRQDALGCYGNPLIQTPNVDALAEQGVRFERMFAAYPVCAPNRASIVTGRYPSVHRLRSNGMRLPKCELTLMQVLRAAGYRTYGSGKMHFGPQWQFPADGSPIMDPDPSTAIDPQPGEDEFPWYGFDHVWVTEDHRMGPYGRYLAKHGFNRKYFARKGGHEAIGMCDLQDEDWQRIVAYYYGMISQIDKNIGRLFDALSRHGQLENTVIVFAADHGENLGDHHLLFKGTTYDCVTNMPFIVSWPGNAHPGETRALLTSSIDIMPTVLDLVGIEHPCPSPLQGVSLLPALADQNVRVRDAVLIENGGVRRSVRTEDALLTWHGQGQRGELYNLAADPECLFNLWDKPKVARWQSQLLHLLIRLMAENVDPLPLREGPW